MLHHGGQGDGHDGQDGGDVKLGHGAGAEGNTEPVGRSDGGEVHPTHDQGRHIGDHHTDQDGQDLDHALAPDVADHHGAQGDQGQQPVGRAVLDGGGGQDQADGNDDGAGNHRREEPHDPAHAEGGDQAAHDQVQQAGRHHAAAGVGQHLGVGDGQVAAFICQHGGHNAEAAQKRKGRAQERGHLAAGDKVEQQRAQTRTQQGGGNVQAGEQRHQHGGAEHGEGVLRTQHQRFARAQFPHIVNGGHLILFLHGSSPLLFTSLSQLPKRQVRHKKGTAPKEAMPCSD